jgi:hypothetical protein
MVAVFTKIFTSPDMADSYFTDDLVDLGQWTAGNPLDLLASLSVTEAGPGNGYGINYMVGVDPRSGGPQQPVAEPSTLSVFGLGLLMLAWSKLPRQKRQQLRAVGTDPLRVPSPSACAKTPAVPAWSERALAEAGSTIGCNYASGMNPNILPKR